MIEIRTLKHDELEQWLDHCVYVFNDGKFSSDFRQYFANHWHNDPWNNLDDILIAVEDGKILSTVRIFFREIYLKGEKITMGGIGEVSTKPEYRGMGLSTKLLNEAIRVMEEKDIKVSLLGTGIQNYYRKLGWDTLKMYCKISDIKSSCDFLYNVRPVDFNRDTDEIKAIYAQYSSRFNGPVVRDSDLYWNKWVKTEGKNFYIVEDNQGRIAAYICVDVGDDNINVKEFCAAQGFENIFDSLAAYTAKIIGKTDCELRYKGVTNTNLDLKRIDVEDHLMFRLINPFILGDIRVESTQQLVDLIEGDNCSNQCNDFLYWGIDGF